MQFHYISLHLVISPSYSDNDERLNGVSNKEADSDIGSHKVHDGGGTEVDRNKKYTDIGLHKVRGGGGTEVAT